MSKYGLLVSQKTIDTYTCPICRFNSDVESIAKVHVDGHEFRDLKEKVRFMGNTAKFDDEETARQFLRFLFNERIHRKDMDDDYEQNLTWTGPGEYFDNYSSKRDDHFGTYHDVSTWTKLR